MIPYCKNNKKDKAAKKYKFLTCLRFGFVRNTSMVKSLLNDEDSTFFLHSSGGMFVCIPNYYNNYSSRSRHSSSANTTVITNGASLSSTSNSTNVTNTANNNSLVQSMTRSTSSATMILSKANEELLKKRLLANNLSRRDRSITECGDRQGRDYADSGLTANESPLPPPKTNTSLSNSFVANSTLAANMSTANSRERSNTKSQHIQYLRLNENNYLIDVAGGKDKAKHDEVVTETESHASSDKNGSEKKENPVVKQPSLPLIQTQERAIAIKKPLTSSFGTTLTNAGSGAAGKFNQEKDDGIFSNNRKNPFYYIESETFIGFLWSWNFMLGKRWRSQNTGDESFQDNMLADFKQFCANQDNRLQNFFYQSKPFLR